MVFDDEFDTLSYSDSADGLDTWSRPYDGPNAAGSVPVSHGVLHLV
jgi:hypothetical protein